MGLRPGQLLIAEVKTKSPFGWEAEETWEERFEVADQYGDWVAVHTEEPWGGSLDLLKEARDGTDKPLVAKGIHASDKSVVAALEAGADWVLVVGRVPDAYADRCLIEPASLYELRSTALNGLKIVWNERDLKTGRSKADPMTGHVLTFDQALGVRSDIFCQASHVRTSRDVHPAAEAVLVGTDLPKFVKSLDK